MEALEKAHESAEGGPWPSDRVPEGYEELSWQYEDAWDEIFLGKLEACGEREMAALCSADPERFDRRYDIGLQYLLAPIEAGKAIAPDDLVGVASCLDVPRADLVRLALAREGIPAALGNANFLLWFWHYSNAVGGVTVQVRNMDVQQALAVLAAARAKLSASLPPWICSSCGQRVAGRWDACWQCGRSADGTPDEGRERSRKDRPGRATGVRTTAQSRGAKSAGRSFAGRGRLP